MGVSTAIEQNRSVMSDKGFAIKMKGGLSTQQKDWYPFVMLFNDNGFSRYSGEDARISILYNFGAFKGSNSIIYDENSPYYSYYRKKYFSLHNCSLEYLLKTNILLRIHFIYTLL